MTEMISSDWSKKILSAAESSKEIIINQQEWIEYFELVNGRKPTLAELYQAQATGEFILERPNILSSNEQVREQRPTKPA